MSLIYHSIEPEANKSSYSSFDTVDFILNTDRNIVRNSIRIEGKIEILKTAGQRVAYTDRIHMPKRVGVHGIIEGIQCSLGGNQIENIKENYNRYVNMVESATKAESDYYQASEICEQKAPTTDAAIALACGKCAKTNTGVAVTGDLDFSFKPVFALNRCDNDLQMSRFGNEARVKINMARVENLLCGIGMAAASDYNVTDLRLTFRSVPPASVPVVKMDAVIDASTTLQSANANFSTRVNGVCDAVSISFLKTTKANDRNLDTSMLEKPPNITEVEFLMNDATNSLLQFSQTDYGEYLDGYLESLRSAGHHRASPVSVKGNSVFGLGQDFYGEFDLSQSKFSVQLQSDISNANQYEMYLFFHQKLQA